jgi:ABC-type multidrug transport system ATPase subunit
MLQAGGVLRDLTVRELVAMMAGLFPAPLDVDRTLSLAQLDGLADRRTERLSGGETQRVRLPSHSSAIRTCSSSTSRRWAWTSSRDTPSG